jgi:hypothetical protein
VRGQHQVLIGIALHGRPSYYVQAPFDFLALCIAK